MIWNHLRRGIGALALVTVLSFPGGAAALPTGAERTTLEPLSGLAFLWDALVALFDASDTETTSTDSSGSGTGGGTDNSGGAMDPNGCPACKPKIDPPTDDTP